ncbi:YhcN/YlaJ family sporulation lipoprotein [Aneurinibacillus sp. Ricciae_BoGa-3]|uniref:YhcN/YlaJ family sporulation lipoprotein n=1 Tax=Aneurinibacillus sp. Ricciae_BoGa-3 TaxID=3022697 RepID=UPI0023424736|nr:YhcN/YlaJ family sporulation lipoprotein [Aneurinibacillus sp. Ricciae_BoGa-3]WCK55755.1 YhcN/YlaJ family sporulation lipoprotein [Aneurinibacillus sp. Ricciae_BoGa-3]
MRGVKTAGVLSAALFLGLALSACGPGTARTDNVHSNQMGIRKNHTGAQPFIGQENSRTARRMSQLAANINGVTRATALVNGRDAVVGIEGAQPHNRKMLERHVQQTLKRAEPGYAIHVTADPGLNQRIRTLNTQMGAGQPIRNVGQDISLLIRDISRTITTPFR